MTLPSAETLLDFEATGLVSTRAALDKLLARALPANDVLFSGVRHLLEPLGIARLADLYLTEDDGQSDREIRVFVVARLAMAGCGDRPFSKALFRDLSPASPDPQAKALQQALQALAAFVCCDEQGTTHVEAEGWTLVHSEIEA